MSATAKSTAIIYDQVVTGKAAPKDKNNNLMIDIHLENQTWKATFFCADVENVGTHKNRQVKFSASEDCTLHFKNGRVFDVPSVPLPKTITTRLPVQDTTTHEETECWITPGLTSTDETASGRTPPKIVVP